MPEIEMYIHVILFLVIVILIFLIVTTTTILKNQGFIVKKIAELKEKLDKE